MTYAIIGFGAVGQALARAFVRSGIEVAVASTRAPQAMAATARGLGPEVVPATLETALRADVIVLAVPFGAHRDVGRALADWHGKTVIDTTNAFGVPTAALGERPSSVVVATAFPGARFGRAFNHLPSAILAEDPARGEARRVIFVAADDDDATEAVGNAVRRLGYSPVSLGTLAEGGRLVQARDRVWAPLIFQDLFKIER